MPAMASGPQAPALAAQYERMLTALALSFAFTFSLMKYARSRLPANVLQGGAVQVREVADPWSQKLDWQCPHAEQNDN